jgi:5,5'-dehydrodivanillate O-demethylase
MKAKEFNDFAHTGPGTLAGRFMRRFWQPVFIAAELKPGRPVRIQTLGEFFTLYRGESGAVFMLEDRCPHRQTALSLGWVEGDKLRCFYHGWMYEGDGQCVEQPCERASFAAKVKAAAYPAREYLGMIFAYLGEGEPPELPRFPELEDADGTLQCNRQVVPCNYFQRVENDLDEAHVHFVHRVSTDSYGLSELPEIVVEEAEYGITRIGERDGGGSNATRTAHWMMPNALLTDLPPSPDCPDWTVFLAYRVPIDDESMMTFAINARRADPTGARQIIRKPIEPHPLQVTADILAGKLRVQDLDPTYRGLFVVQDNVALAGQGLIVDRSRDRLGQSDRGVILLRKLWAREMRKLAEGEPLTVWRRPTEKLPLIVEQPQAQI